MRHNTERPITCTEGTNILIGNDPEKIQEAIRKVLNGEVNEGRVPEKWDGKASARIVEVLLTQ